MLAIARGRQLASHLARDNSVPLANIVELRYCYGIYTVQELATIARVARQGLIMYRAGYTNKLEVAISYSNLATLSKAFVFVFCSYTIRAV